MTQKRLDEHKENMDKVVDKLGGTREDIWQNGFIYDMALAIHDILIELNKMKEG